MQLCSLPFQMSCLWQFALTSCVYVQHERGIRAMFSQSAKLDSTGRSSNKLPTFAAQASSRWHNNYGSCHQPQCDLFVGFTYTKFLDCFTFVFSQNLWVTFLEVKNLIAFNPFTGAEFTYPSFSLVAPLWDPLFVTVCTDITCMCSERGWGPTAEPRLDEAPSHPLFGWTMSAVWVARLDSWTAQPIRSVIKTAGTVRTPACPVTPL